MRDDELHIHIRRFLRQVHELIQAGLVVPVVTLTDGKLRYAEPAVARRMLKHCKARLATEDEVEADAKAFVLAMIMPGEENEP